MFYTKAESHVSILAPINGIILPYEESIDKLNGHEGLALIASSETVVSPINGILSGINTNRKECSILGDFGEILKIRLLSPHTVIQRQATEQRIRVGEPLFRIQKLTHRIHTALPLITLILDNSDDFRAITVFEGICRSVGTEIMSFCK